MHVKTVDLRQDPAHRAIPAADEDAERVEVPEQAEAANTNTILFMFRKKNRDYENRKLFSSRCGRWLTRGRGRFR